LLFLLQAGMLKGERWVPPDLEVAHLPHMMGHPYGGLFLFSQSARMMRPVRYWAGGGGLELIGTLEQVGHVSALLSASHVSVVMHQQWIYI